MNPNEPMSIPKNTDLFYILAMGVIHASPWALFLQDEIDWWPFRTTFLLSCWIAGTERSHRLESSHYVWRIWMQRLTQRYQWNHALHAVSDAVHSRTYPSFGCGTWTCFCLQANDDIHWGAWHGCTMTMSYKAASLEDIPSLYTEQTSPNKHMYPQNKIQYIK